MGAYHCMPATGGYGASGVPDIIACYQGRFIGIECKANGGKPTALQKKHLEEAEQIVQEHHTWGKPIDVEIVAEKNNN